MGLGTLIELNQFIEKYGLKLLREYIFAESYLNDKLRREQGNVHQVG